MNSTDMFFKEMQGIPRLTVSQERTLLEERKAITQQLCIAYLPLVISIAKNYTKKGVPLLDLIQEGTIALITAINKFSYSKDCKISTYATYMIHAKIIQAIVEQSRPYKVPVSQIKNYTSFLKTKASLSNELGHEPSIQELSTAMKISVDKLKNLEFTMQYPLSLDQGTSVDTKEISLGERISDPHHVENIVIRKMEYEKLMQIIEKRLTSKEKHIIFARFGFYGEKQTLSSIGKNLS